MNRRQFVTGLSVTGLGLGAGGYLALKKTTPLTTHHAIAVIDEMLDANLMSTGEWSLFKIFMHCTQSIQLSMYAGYPEHKSDTFKQYVGTSAFSVFSHLGTMKHGLNEPIPGATPISSTGDTRAALLELKLAYQDFDKFNGQMKPHFAYGPLSKADYEKAHVLHLLNHLDEIRITA